MINITTSGLNEVIARLHYFSANAAEQLKPTFQDTLADLVNYIRQEKLSGQVLKIKTGDLYNSIGSYVSVTGSILNGAVFSRGLNYAAIQEFGGQTSPHIIMAKNGKALHFMLADGAEVFAMSVNHPGSKMPERSFIRSAVSDKIVEIQNALRTATVRAINSN